jgi:hypothetical protein
MKPMTAIVLVLFAMLLVPLVSVLCGTILWLLWPITAVEVFHAPTMTWWQAVAGYWTLGMLATAFKISVETKGKD